MAGFFTDFANNKALDLFFGAAAYTPPGVLYLGLSLTTAHKGGYVTEPSGGGYARVALTNNSTNFPAAVAGSKSNAAAVMFPTPTSDWGTVQSLFVADAAVGGSVLAMADLIAPKLIHSGSATVKVAAGSLYLSQT